MSSQSGISTLDNPMETPLPEILSLDHKQFLAIDHLIKGRCFANQLLNILRNPADHSNGGAVYVEELVMKILTSFSDALSKLSPNDSGEFPVSGLLHDSGHYGDRQVSGASRKRRPARNDKRGSYKRKTSDARSKVSSSVEDGYAWRKYGQKEILNCKQPRCYFRCTHKHDRGCKATKQVQKLEDDSNLYQITYYGYHTCKNSPNKPTNMFQDIQSPCASVLSFESNNLCTKKDEEQSPSSYPTVAASASTLVNEEEEEEYKAQTETFESENVFSAQSIWLNEVTPFGSFDNELALTNGFDHEYLFYYDPYQGLDFPMMRHTEFGADMQLDDVEFYQSVPL